MFSEEQISTAEKGNELFDLRLLVFSAMNWRGSRYEGVSSSNHEPGSPKE
jgi:hypothetical protein